jgi:hypothetical protein
MARLDDGDFAGQLREWLKTLRKKNASVIFATQSLSDIANSPIAPAVVESCPTRIFLPNERAIEPQIMAIYRDFGLNDRQIAIIARAASKREYYCQTQRGNRLFELGLGPVALALCAASGKDDHRLIDAVLTKHGRGFLPVWFEARGVAGQPIFCGIGGAMMEKLFRIRTKYFRSGCVVAVGTALAFLVPVVPAYAQWAVYDGANHVQNVLIAARALQQIDNQITSGQSGADAGQSGRNLASLPLSTLSTLQSTISQTTALLAQAQNTAYSVQSVEQQYQQVYVRLLGHVRQCPVQPGADALAEFRGGFEDALKLQARVVGNIPSGQFGHDAARVGQPDIDRGVAGRAGRQPAWPCNPGNCPTFRPNSPPMAGPRPRNRRATAAAEAESEAQYQHFSQYDAYVPGTVSMFGSKFWN